MFSSVQSSDAFELYITIFWGGYKLTMGRDNSVGIATGYGLDGPGIESRWGGLDFSQTFRPAQKPTQPPVQ
jgi:hypothetical protein